MPQLGNDKNPMILNGSSKPKSTRVLGLLGSAYSGEAKQKYADNYDRIFGKKKTNKMLEKYKEQLTDVKQYQENLTESEEINEQ